MHSAPRFLSCLLALSMVAGCTGDSGKKKKPVVTTDTVDESGGTIVTESGLQLVFPTLAVDQTTDVTVTELAGRAPDGYDDAEPIVRFEPEGLVFAKPVVVHLPVPSGATNMTAYWSNADGTGYFDAGGVLAGDHVELEVVHFSTGFAAQASGVRTVNGSRVVSWTSASGVQNIPVDLTTATLAALVPDGAGGFTQIPGTGRADGTFEIPDVPYGSYWLQLDDQFVFTDATAIDLGYAHNGRPDATVPTATTTIDLDVTGMSSWADGDSLELFSTEADTWYFTMESSFAGPAVGDTRLVMQVDETGSTGSGADPGRLIQGSLGDRAVLAKLSGRTTADTVPIAYLAMDRVLEPAPFDQTDGGNTVITGAFSDVSLANSLSLDLRVSQFHALAAGAHPDAFYVNPPSVDFYVLGHPGGLAEGAHGATADFLHLAVLSSGGDVVATAMNFGTPLTGQYGLHGMTQWGGYGVTYQIPTTTSPAFLVGGGFSAAELSALTAGPVVPPVGNVGTLLINGLDLQTEQSGVGTTPTLSWTAPSFGTPNLYRVDVWHFFVNGSNGTSRELVTQLTTAGTSMQIPPGVLTTGESYAVKIRALVAPLPASAPYRKGIPNAEAAVLSSRFVP